MVNPLPSFVHSIYSFFFVKCSGIKSPFSPIFILFFSLGFLHSWCKNYGHSLMVFLHPFGSKVIKTRGRRLQNPYLMNLSTFRGSLIVYLFFFSRFSLLLLFLLLLSVSPYFVGFSPPVLNLHFIHVYSYSTFSQTLLSLSHA